MGVRVGRGGKKGRKIEGMVKGWRKDGKKGVIDGKHEQNMWEI